MNSTNFWDRYTRAFTGVPRPKLISGIGIVYDLGPGTPVHARVYLSQKLEIYFDQGLPRVHLRFLCSPIEGTF